MDNKYMSSAISGGNDSYYDKYFKYKNKYLELKNNIRKYQLSIKIY